MTIHSKTLNLFKIFWPETSSHLYHWIRSSWLQTSLLSLMGLPKSINSRTLGKLRRTSNFDRLPAPVEPFITKQPNSFEERKLLFCGKNEKTFIEKLNKFTNFNFIFTILWQTRRIKSIFNNKDKSIHRFKAIYKGDCSCSSKKHQFEKWCEKRKITVDLSKLCPTVSYKRLLLDHRNLMRNTAQTMVINIFKIRVC